LPGARLKTAQERREFCAHFDLIERWIKSKRAVANPENRPNDDSANGK
jgi:hypothetical protein